MDSEQSTIVENPFWVRMDRRIGTYAAAMSDRRGVATVRFVDFKKMPLNKLQPRRYAVYGDLLACFLILQEWDTGVKEFGMGEGKAPVTLEDPGVDASAPVISVYTSGECMWTTCMEEMPTTKSGEQQLAARIAEAKANGASHQVFTYQDGRANWQRLENYVFLNPMLHRTPGDRFDCRYELGVIRGALKVRETTTLGYLQAAEGISIARMQGTVAGLLHSGDLETVKGLDSKPFTLRSELRWSSNSILSGTTGTGKSGAQKTPHKTRTDSGVSRDQSTGTVRSRPAESWTQRVMKSIARLKRVSSTVLEL